MKEVIRIEAKGSELEDKINEAIQYKEEDNWFLVDIEYAVVPDPDFGYEESWSEVLLVFKADTYAGEVVNKRGEH